VIKKLIGVRNHSLQIFINWQRLEVRGKRVDTLLVFECRVYYTLMPVSQLLSKTDVKKCLPTLSNISNLNTGGQKQVFKAHIGSETVAVKFVQIEVNGNNIIDETALDRVLREIKIINSLNSANLPKTCSVIPGFFRTNNAAYYYYGEKFINGYSVSQLITARRISYREAKQMLVDVTTAIKFLWESDEHIVHRDIKPSNIVYSNDDGVYVLIDAGLALAMHDVSLTPTGMVVGTLSYMSPEQIKGKKRELDFRSDLYSLGVTVYQAITQKHPYCQMRMSDSELQKAILFTKPTRLETFGLSGFPAGFLSIIETLLNKRPHQRFNSCDKLLGGISVL